MGAAVFKFFLGTLGLTMNSKSFDRISMARPSE
jgi:hypothetical protein